MAFNLRSWLTGFALGVSGKPLPLSTGEAPIAYSYNGTVLPKLPEWDKTVYPYAAIEHIPTYGRYQLVLLGTDAHHYKAVDSDIWLLTASDGLLYWLPYSSDAWQSVETEAHTIIAGESRTITGELSRGAIWCNFDLMDGDGKLILSASEPVPVYE